MRTTLLATFDTPNQGVYLSLARHGHLQQELSCRRIDLTQSALPYQNSPVSVPRETLSNS